jgi:CPA1 family monovalent cation:H+ antiporter
MLGLKDEGSVDQEVRLARVETARAALRLLDEEQSGDPSVDILRSEYQARMRSGESGPAPEGRESHITELQRRAVHAQRRTILDLRARQVIGDDAFHAAEEEIDLLELTADSRIRPGPDNVTPQRPVG